MKMGKFNLQNTISRGNLYLTSKEGKLKQILLVVFIILNLSSHSSPNANKHAAEFLDDFGFYTGKNKNIRLAVKEISNLIDDVEKIPFKNVNSKFGKYGHRNFGHWGFSSDIPFNKNEYLKELLSEGVTRKEIIQAWKIRTNEMTDIVVKYTGITNRKQARALAGLIYDHHLLKDYSDKLTQPLQNINHLEKDIIKNFEKLFKKNSPITMKFKEEISKIPKNIPATEKSKLITKIIKKSEVAKYLDDIYSKEFKDNKIRTLNRNTEHLLQKGKAMKVKNIKAKVAGKAALMAGMVSGGLNTWKVVNGEMELQEAVYKTVEDTSIVFTSTYVSEAFIEKIGSKYAMTSIVKEGVPLSAKTLGAGVNYGIATFIFDETRTIWDFTKGEISDEEFYKATGVNAMRGFGSGTAAYAAALMGASPGGPIVIAVSFGGYVLVNTAISEYEKLDRNNYLYVEDVLGHLPLRVQRQKNIFDLEDHYEGKKTIFDLEDHYKDKKTIFDLEDHYEGKKTIFD